MVKMRQALMKITPYLGLLLVILFFTVVTNGKLLDKGNLSVLVNNAFLIMLAAVAAVFVYSYGGIDLSLGALQSICIVMTCLIIKTDMKLIWLALVICIIFGACSGFLIGGISGVLGVSPFIGSLAVSYILKGISNTIMLSGTNTTFPAQYAGYDNWGIKITVLIAGIAVCFLLYKYTKLGRIQKAIGGSRNVVDFTGINSKKYIIIAHMIAGLGVGIGTFLITPRYSIVTPQAGQGFEMDVLIAILLGGMPAAGGARSRFSAPIIGSLIITVLNNGFGLWGIPSSTLQVTKGLLFIVVVILNTKQEFINFKFNILKKRRKENV